MIAGPEPAWSDDRAYSKAARTSGVSGCFARRGRAAPPSRTEVTMAVRANLTTKASDPDQVDSYMKQPQRPLKAEAILRVPTTKSARNQMERAVVLLHRANETVQAEGVQALHRRFQSISQGLRLSGISERSENPGQPSGLPGGRLCRRKASGEFLVDRRCELQASGLQAVIRSRYWIVARGQNEVSEQPSSTESNEPQIVLRDSPFAKVIPGTACASRKSRNIWADGVIFLS
jgi:hypothetical protein